MDEINISQYDRNLIEQLLQTFSPAYGKQEIVEENIETIEYAAYPSYNRNLDPADGTAKWFRDELGQLWVKVKIANGSPSLPELQTVVIPASRVVTVNYKPHPRA